MTEGVRAHFVVSCLPDADPGLCQQGHPTDRGFDMAHFPVLVDALFLSVGLFRVRHACEDSRPFVVKVEACGKVD